MIRREFGATTLRRSANQPEQHTRRHPFPWRRSPSPPLHRPAVRAPAVVVASLDALSTAATHDAAPAGRRAGYSDPTAAAPFFKLAD